MSPFFTRVISPLGADVGPVKIKGKAVSETPSYKSQTSLVFGKSGQMISTFTHWFVQQACADRLLCASRGEDGGPPALLQLRQGAERRGSDRGDLPGDMEAQEKDRPVGKIFRPEGRPGKGLEVQGGWARGGC